MHRDQVALLLCLVVLEAVAVGAVQLSIISLPLQFPALLQLLLAPVQIALEHFVQLLRVVLAIRPARRVLW
jgi:hypothetical protein